MSAVWRWLTEPLDSVTNSDMRRQARMFSSLLLITFFMLAVATVFAALMRGSWTNLAANPPELIAKIGIWLLGYGLSRIGYHRAAVRFFCLAGTLVIFHMALTAGSYINNPLYYLIAMPLLGSMFLPLRELLLLAALQFIGIALLAAAIPASSALNGLLFNAVFAPFIVLMSYYRSRLEAERKQEITESERRYRQIIENTHDVVCIIDSSGIITFVNARMAEMLGAPIENIIGQPPHQFMEADQKTEGLRRFEQRKQGIGERYEMLVKRPDGSILHAFVSANPVFDETGNFLYTVNLISDITERIRAEETLRASEERFRLIAENASDIVTLHDRDGRLLYVNPAARTALGYEPAELMTLDPFAPFHPENRERVRQHMSDTMNPQQGAPPITYRIQRKSGEYIWVETTTQPIIDTNGAVVGLVASTRDVTMREHSSAALRASENRLRTVLHKMPVMLDAFDETLLISFWNEECERVTGYSAAEIVGNSRAVELLYPDPEQRARMFEAWRRLGNNFRNYEERLTCKDGSARIISWSNISELAPIPGWHFWAIGVDVTEQRETEKRQMALALEHDRAKLLSRFIQDISHDLRNPLSVIGTGMYIIERKLAEAEKAKVGDNMVRINRQIEHLRRQLDNMTTMAQLYRSDFEYNMQPHDLNDLAAHALSRQQDSADQKGHRLILEQAAERIDILVDAYEFGRMIEHLILNAIKFTPDGGSIVVRTRQNMTRGILEVMDNGIGISADEQRHLFEPFYRADAARNIETGGMGLGLSLSKKILDAHNCEIEIESVPGAGSTFRVLVPLHSAAVSV